MLEFGKKLSSVLSIGYEKCSRGFFDLYVWNLVFGKVCGVLLIRTPHGGWNLELDS